MRKMTFFVVSLLITVSLSAQKLTREDRLNAGPKVTNLKSTQVQNPKAIVGILAYDNGEVDFGLGNAGAHTIEIYNKFPAADITGFVDKELTHMKIGFDDPSGYNKAYVRVKESDINSTAVFEEEIDATAFEEGINLIALTGSYKIPADKDIYVGVYFESTGGYGIGVDTDGNTGGDNSGLFFFNGTFYGPVSSIGYSDYVIQGILTDDGVADGDLLDLTIIGAAAKTADCELSATESIVVTLLNNGVAPINEKFNLTVEVNNTPITQQVSPTGFTAGTEAVFEIGTFDMSAFGSYDVSVAHDFSDHVLFNNSFATTLTAGDGQVTIDLTTDNWASETAWYLFDEAGEVVASNGALSGATNYVTNICVAASGCYTWAITDSYGDGISDVGGSFKIYYNGEMVGQSPAGGNFGYEYYVFGIGEGCPENDLVLESLNIPAQAAPGNVDIKGTLFNYGTANLTSFDIVYTIGDHTSATYSVTGVDIATGDSYAFTHDVPYNFATDGTYTVKVEVSNPNGVADENPENNIMETDITIVTGILAKQQLFEHFTSSTCAPCASYTPTADALLANNAGNYSLIRYQVNWPGSGDPYYIDEAGDRVDYYDVSGVPSVFRNGTYDMDVTQAGFDAYASETSVINLDAVASFEGTTVTVAATISPIADLPAGLTAHIVVVENETTDNVSSNGETEFHNVMMMMLPSSDGTTLEAIAADASVTITESYDMSTTFVEEMDDLTAVIFVQDDATKEVLQSIMVPITAPQNNVNVTFNVNMAGPIAAGMFTPGTDVLYVTGSFNGWNEPSTGGSLELSDADNDGTYTVSMEMAANYGEVQYKYFINAGWAGGEWDGEPNRIVNIADADVTTADTWNNAIEENQLAAVQVYPNPFQNTVTLSNLEHATQIAISNMLGQQVINVTVDELTETISTANLNNGIYFITITDANNNIRTERIVKQ